MCAMVTLFVGNLPGTITEHELRELFLPFGQVQTVTVAMNSMTGMARGFGYVDMADERAAQVAIAALNLRRLQGQALVVRVVRPSSEPNIVR
jgi:RNA recognition motif-containing protein